MVKIHRTEEHSLMNRTDRFLNAGRYCQLGLVLLLLAGQSVMAQDEARTQFAPVRVNLKLDKETIMLGEPMFIAFEVTNMSGDTLCLGIGGDYRNKFGRPESFDVSVTSADGTALRKPEAITMGGLIGCAPIQPGETYTVRLFLPHWATIERTGTYKVNVKRRMGFSIYGSSFTYSAPPKYSMEAEVNGEFTVVPADDNKMGAVINSLGSVMLDSSNPLSVESTTALATINDKRVISYLTEAVRNWTKCEFNDPFSRENVIKSNAIAILGTYDDDRAIQALQAAMDSSCDDTRLEVASAFGDSPHKAAIKLLLKMQDDSYWFVRLRVAQGLKNQNSKEALAARDKLLKDENEDVRKAAKEIGKSISR